TGSQVLHRVALLSRAILSLSITPGSVVVLVAQTSAAVMEAMLAVLDAGCILCPVNWRWTTAELSQALVRLGPALVLFDISCSDLVHKALVSAFPPSSLDLRNHHSQPPQPQPQRQPEPQLQLLSSPCGTALLVFTSGTTAAPKAVRLSHAAFHIQSLVKLALVGYCREDTYLHLAPLFHIGGLSSAFAALMAGCTQVFLPRFEPRLVLRIIVRHTVSAFIAVPTMLQDLAAAATAAAAEAACGGSSSGSGGTSGLRPPWGCVRRILVGAGPTSPQLQDAICRTFPGADLLSAYGMTEACSSMTFRHLSSAASVSPSGTPPAAAAATSAVCVGWPAPGVQIRIRIRTEAAAADAGATRGPHVMLGYWGNSAATAEAISADGWLSTGDLGYLAQDGSLWLLGRAKDMIKSGGENVFAPEVEAALCSHPAVAAVAVVGLPDERLGEKVAALVVLRNEWSFQDTSTTSSTMSTNRNATTTTTTTTTSGCITSLADLQAHCRAQGLAGFRLPRFAAAQRQPLPTTSSGKVAKAEVRERL
ncbi:hypothetical protein VOLCADRAFT_41779, partial [Volvox carteri f. nagariensis]